ncbi:MAG: hypothetical protein ACJ72N_09645 [Labedaea sp.]
MVSKQQVPLDVKTDLRVGPPLARRAELAGPKQPVSTPGKHLRKAVESVLAELGAGAHPDLRQLHRLDDTLRGALAWTAAVGDTCRVAAAVNAVRKARTRLDADDPDQARASLLSARDGLRVPMPGPRLTR